MAKRKLDKRKTLLKIVTGNGFVMATNLEKVTLKARKLLYYAIAQCQMSDTEFYEYKIGAMEFAEEMDIERTGVYSTAKSIANELATTYISFEAVEENKRKSFVNRPLFQEIGYSNGEIFFQLNKAVAPLFLKLKGDFSQPLLSDFIQMRSVYSMSIWHLMQIKMQSVKPPVTGYGDNREMHFEISIEDLRKVTGTENKFKQNSEFRIKVLDKAIREIRECCGVEVKYTYQKAGRKIIGYNFTAISTIYYDFNNVDPELRKRFGA